MGTAERKQREFERREAALLGAAAAELAERDDWQAVTVDRIAARAEHAKGTVYKHFASKDEIWARLAIDWAGELHRDLQDLDASRPFEAVLRDFVALCCGALAGQDVRARLGRFVRGDDVLAGLTPPTRAALADADARQMELLEGLIDWGIAEGALPEAPLPPRLFATQALLDGSAGRRSHAPEAMVADAILAVLRAPAGPRLGPG